MLLNYLLQVVSHQSLASLASQEQWSSLFCVTSEGSLSWYRASCPVALAFPPLHAPLQKASLLLHLLFQAFVLHCLAYVPPSYTCFLSALRKPPKDSSATAAPLDSAYCCVRCWHFLCVLLWWGFPAPFECHPRRFLNMRTVNPPKHLLLSFICQGSVVSERDYESLVMMRMRQAAERQKLIEQMKQEDEESCT